MILGPCRTLFLLGLVAAPADPPSVGVFVKAGPEVRELPDAERKAREKAYSSKEPWWSFLESERNAWKAVAAWVADGLDEFAKENAEALTGVPAPKR